MDEENSYLCGYLKITGLTFEYPMLTTFFDGEIISKKYPFLTRKWDADEDVDRKHWVCCALNSLIFHVILSFSWPPFSPLTFCFQSKFSAFKNKYEKTFNSDNFDYDSLAKSDYVFMRWKEHFLVRKKHTHTNHVHIMRQTRASWFKFVRCTFFVGTGTRSYDQRYQWCFICWFLLYLLSKIKSRNGRLLLSQIIGMVCLFLFCWWVNSLRQALYWDNKKKCNNNNYNAATWPNLIDKST